MEGRIDHLAIDEDAQRLYVAALGNNTVEVLDLKTNRHLQSLRGFREPQGIAVASAEKMVVDRQRSGRRRSVHRIGRSSPRQVGSARRRLR